jgi:hypothetical protein
MREELRIDLVEGAEPARLFKGLIGTYHYLGYQQAKGAQVKYLVRYRELWRIQERLCSTKG